MAIDFLFQPLDIPLLIVKAQAKNLCFLLDTGSIISMFLIKESLSSSSFRVEQPNSNNSG